MCVSLGDTSNLDARSCTTSEFQESGKNAVDSVTAIRGEIIINPAVSLCLRSCTDIQ